MSRQQNNKERIKKLWEELMARIKEIKPREIEKIDPKVLPVLKHMYSQIYELDKRQIFSTTGLIFTIEVQYYSIIVETSERLATAIKSFDRDKVEIEIIADGLQKFAFTYGLQFESNNARHFHESKYSYEISLPD